MIRMDKPLLTILLGLAVTLAVLTLPFVNYWMIADAQNTAAPQNATLSEKPMRKLIIKDNIATVVDTRTNETLSVRNLTANTGNTTNESLVKNTGNTTNESLVKNTGNTTNESLVKNTGNTTKENLTAKFEKLQGK